MIGSLREQAPTFARFAAVGSLCAVITLGSFSAMTLWGDVHYLVGGPVAYAAGIVVGFLLNRTWTFAADRGDPRRQAIRFVCVSIAAIGANALLLHLLVGLAGLPKLLGEVVTLAVISPSTFTANRLWSFVGPP